MNCEILWVIENLALRTENSPKQNINSDNNKSNSLLSVFVLFKVKDWILDNPSLLRRRDSDSDVTV